MAAAFVAGAGDFGLFEAVVIALATGGASVPAGDAFDQRVFVDIEFDHMVEAAPAIAQDRIERRGLCGRARIPVKNRAGIRAHRVQLFADQRGYDIVRHQFARIHHRLGLQSDGSARLDRGTQHVAGRKLLQAVPFDQALGLRALARAGWSQQDDIHWQELPSCLSGAGYPPAPVMLSACGPSVSPS